MVPVGWKPYFVFGKFCPILEHKNLDALNISTARICIPLTCIETLFTFSVRCLKDHKVML